MNLGDDHPTFDRRLCVDPDPCSGFGFDPFAPGMDGGLGHHSRGGEGIHLLHLEMVEHLDRNKDGACLTDSVSVFLLGAFFCLNSTTTICFVLSQRSAVGLLEQEREPRLSLPEGHRAVLRPFVEPLEHVEPLLVRIGSFPDCDFAVLPNCHVARVDPRGVMLARSSPLFFEIILSSSFPTR